MRNPKDTYNDNVKSITDLGELHSLIQGKLPLLSEQSNEILRAQLVLIVGSLDCFVHDCVNKGILDIYQGSRATSKATDSYLISFLTLKNVLQEDNEQLKMDHLEAFIYKQNSKNSYQSVKAIERALSLIGLSNVWSKLTTSMNMTAENIKGQLSLIVDRRNKIAHEADINRITGCKYPINQNDVNTTISFINKLVNAITTLL
jgi:hypothetical protein